MREATLHEETKREPMSRRRYSSEELLEKLPPISRKGSSAHHLTSRAQDSFLDNKSQSKGCEMVALREWQQEYSPEKTSKNVGSAKVKNCSARKMHEISIEDYSIPGGKVSGTVKMFPLKPMFYRRAHSLSNNTTYKTRDLEKQDFSHVPSPPQISTNHNRRQGHRYLYQPCTNKAPNQSSQDDCTTRGQMVNGCQKLCVEQQGHAANQAWLTKDIRKREMILQEKLFRAGEELKKVYNEGTASGSKVKRQDYNRYYIEKERRDEHDYWEDENTGNWGKGGWQQEEWRVKPRLKEGEREMRMDRYNWGSRGQETNEGKRDTRWEREVWETQRGEMAKAKHRERQRNKQLNGWERDSDQLVQERSRNRGGPEKTERVVMMMQRECSDQEEWENQEVDYEINEGRWRTKERRRRAGRDIDRGNQRNQRRREKYDNRRMEAVVSRDDIRMNKVMGQKRQTESDHHLRPRPVQEGSSSNGMTQAREQARRPAASPPLATQWSGRLQQVELNPEESPNNCVQRVPCKVCHRCFAADRLEKHRRVCEKMQRSNRKVFDSSQYRAKGTDLEEYMKTNSRCKSPEIKKINWRQKHEAFIRDLRQARIPPTGGQQPWPGAEPDPDYVACPHCGRRFAPGPAERHIPKCQNIKSRPPPPPRHRR